MAFLAFLTRPSFFFQLNLAPEVLAKQEYSEKADVYSFGVVVWELVTQNLPFEEQRDQLYLLPSKIVIENLRLKIPVRDPIQNYFNISQIKTLNNNKKKRKIAQLF